MEICREKGIALEICPISYVLPFPSLTILYRSLLANMPISQKRDPGEFSYLAGRWSTNKLIGSRPASYVVYAHASPPHSSQ